MCRVPAGVMPCRAVANDSGDLPVLVVDRAHCSDLDDLAREFSRLLCHGA